MSILLKAQDSFEIIRQNIQQLNKNNRDQTQSKRNLLNKWFLDSIKNYFMEQHAAPLLLECLNCGSAQQVKNIIHAKIDPSLPKYMSILINYVNFLIEFKKLGKFQGLMLDMLEKDVTINYNQSNYNIEKLIRKQFVSLMILTFCEYYQKTEIQSFYDLWNITFPNDKQQKKRLSKYDVNKQSNQKAIKDQQESEEIKSSCDLIKNHQNETYEENQMKEIKSDENNYECLSIVYENQVPQAEEQQTYYQIEPIMYDDEQVSESQICFGGFNEQSIHFDSIQNTRQHFGLDQEYIPLFRCNNKTSLHDSIISNNYEPQQFNPQYVPQYEFESISRSNFFKNCLSDFPF